MVLTNEELEGKYRKCASYILSGKSMIDKMQAEIQSLQGRMKRLERKEDESASGHEVPELETPEAIPPFLLVLFHSC